MCSVVVRECHRLVTKSHPGANADARCEVSILDEQAFRQDKQWIVHQNSLVIHARRVASGLTELEHAGSASEDQASHETNVTSDLKSVFANCLAE